MQPPDQNALREHGAKADEREEERVGGGAPPETAPLKSGKLTNNPANVGFINHKPARG